MACYEKYNISGYKVHLDHSLELTHNATGISLSKALYLAKLWSQVCIKIEIIEEKWAVRLDGKDA